MPSSVCSCLRRSNPTFTSASMTSSTPDGWRPSPQASRTSYWLPRRVPIPPEDRRHQAEERQERRQHQCPHGTAHRARCALQGPEGAIRLHRAKVSRVPDPSHPGSLGTRRYPRTSGTSLSALSDPITCARVKNCRCSHEEAVARPSLELWVGTLYKCASTDHRSTVTLCMSNTARQPASSRLHPRAPKRLPGRPSRISVDVYEPPRHVEAPRRIVRLADRRLPIRNTCHLDLVMGRDVDVMRMSCEQ